jgi:hypothetical protein
MKTVSWISALSALVLGALPGTAAADGGMYVPPFKISGCCQFQIRIQLGNANADLAPWYLYFPADAQQQMAGPVLHYPNWPQAPAAPVRYAPQQGLQRVGYYPAAPSYWYGQ